MAYRFQVNKTTCINCGICMDLCPVRCLDMTRPAGEGEVTHGPEQLSPIPGVFANREWMMLFPVQVATCVGCQVCVQECPTNAISIEAGSKNVAYAQRGVVTPLPTNVGWQPLDAYTRAFAEEPGEAPWGENHDWQVAERKSTWQSSRSWLGERKEDLRAPCQAACPVGTNAGLYVSLIAEGRYEEALHVAAEPNPFPAICGRVCTAPCEDVCRRGEFDAPIAIRDLKRFASDHGRPLKRTIVAPKHKYRERIAIVGAGPTGLSAAYYLARRGYNITVYDAMPVAGGMMAIGIPDYRLPRVELNRDIEAIRELGVDFKLNTAIGRDVTLNELQESYDSVLLAVGAQRSQRLGIPGEATLQGVVPATTFLKQFNLEGEQTRLSGEVLVIGGGSTAMDAARSALRAGANAVHIVYRRSQKEMPAQRDEIVAAIEEGVQIHELLTPIEILGQDGHMRAALCQRMKLEEPDAQGRRRPAPIPGATFQMAANTIIVAIGEAPDPSFLPEGTSIDIAAWGGLLINTETLATGAKGVFAAGDVTYGPKTIIHAAAHGRRAAQSIHAYLRKIPISTVTEMPAGENETQSLLPANGRVSIDLRMLPRAEMPVLQGDVNSHKSTEFARGLSEEEARREAGRCLRCDLAYRCPTITVTASPKSKEALTV